MKILLPTDRLDRAVAIAGLSAGQQGKTPEEHPCPLLEPSRSLYQRWHKVGAAMLQFEPHRRAGLQIGTSTPESVSAEKARMAEARRLPGD